MIPNAHGDDLSLKCAHGVHMKKKVAIVACRVRNNFGALNFSYSRKPIPIYCNVLSLPSGVIPFASSISLISYIEFSTQAESTH